MEGVLGERYLSTCECVIGHEGDLPLAQTTRLTSDILLPQSFRSLFLSLAPCFFLILCLCFHCFLFF